MWSNDIFGHIIWIADTLVHDCNEGILYQASKQMAGVAHTHTHTHCTQRRRRHHSSSDSIKATDQKNTFIELKCV